MARENVEIVRRAYEEFERGNFWVPGDFDPSVRVVWLSPIAGGEPESVGLDAMGNTVKEWMKSWEQVTNVPAEAFEAVGLAEQDAHAES